MKDRYTPPQKRENLLFHLAADAAVQNDVDEFDRLIEESAFSDEQRERYAQKLWTGIQKTLSRKHIKRRSGSLLRIASIAIVCVMLVFSVGMVTVEAFRITVFNFFVNNTQTYMHIMPSDSTLLPEGWTGYAFGRLPYGFYLESYNTTSLYTMISYSDANDNYIKLTQHEITYAGKIDSENKNIEEISVNENSGYLVWDDSTSIIYLFMERANLVVSTTLPKEVSLELAEHIAYIE